MPKIRSGPQTVTQHVYKRLKSRIVTGSVPPGGRLIIGKIAKDFGVSLTPVRESLRLLERDGLVRNLPHRGAVAQKLTRRQCEELFVVRRMLESKAARLACKHADQKQMKRIAAANQSMTEALAASDARAYRNADIAFHRAVAAASGNSLLDELIGELTVRFQAFLSVTVVDPRESPEGLSEHSSIIRALRDGDEDAAEHWMLFHIDRSLDRAVKADKVS